MKIALSTKGRLENFPKFAAKLDNSKPIVFIVGAVAKGNPTMEVGYHEDSICISKYALSASVCLGRMMNAYEDLFDIV